MLLSFRLNIRAKLTDDEEWHRLAPSVQTREVTCKKGADLCTWFQVASIKTLHYNMYDVAIEILKGPQLKELHHQPINFRIAYVDSYFTHVQLEMRFLFGFLSFCLFFTYMLKIYVRMTAE